MVQLIDEINCNFRVAKYRNSQGVVDGFAYVCDNHSMAEVVAHLQMWVRHNVRSNKNRQASVRRQDVKYLQQKNFTIMSGMEVTTFETLEDGALDYATEWCKIVCKARFSIPNFSGRHNNTNILRAVTRTEIPNPKQLSLKQYNDGI